MAFDAPRKTLDEIRSEIDAEFGAPPPSGESADSPPGTRPSRADEYAAALEEFHEHFMRHRSKRGYIIAAAVGCIVGQLALVGSYLSLTDQAILTSARVATVAALRSVLSRSPVPLPSTPPPSEPVSEPAAPSAAMRPPAPQPQPAKASPAPTSPLPAVSSPVLTSPLPPVSSPEPASATPTEASPSVASSPPTEPASRASTPSLGDASAPRVVAPAPPEAETPAPPSVPTVTPPRRIEAPKKSPPRRVVKRPPPAPSETVSASAPLHGSNEPVAALGNWAQSQEEVRQALKVWLVSSGLANDSIVSDTVVFLGADGRTARTHVPVRQGGSAVIREQRWVRLDNRWSLIDDREAWQNR